MIGKLKGIVESIGLDHVMVDVNGVVYVVYCSGHTLRQVPTKGSPVVIRIETHVREDHIHLYGFSSKEEHELFLKLTKVNGVGNKMALALFATFNPYQVTMAICSSDKKALTCAPGVGPRLAERIITELKDKLAKGLTDDTMANAVSTSAGNSKDKKGKSNNNISDAISALVQLGYGRMDSFTVIQKIASENPDKSVDGLIKDGLKELSSLALN